MLYIASESQNYHEAFLDNSCSPNVGHGLEVSDPALSQRWYNVDTLNQTVWLLQSTMREMISQTDLYLVILSSKTYVYEDRMTKL